MGILYLVTKQQCSQACANQHGAHILKIDCKFLDARGATLDQGEQHCVGDERNYPYDKR